MITHSMKLCPKKAESFTLKFKVVSYIVSFSFLTHKASGYIRELKAFWTYANLPEIVLQLSITWIWSFRLGIKSY